MLKKIVLLCLLSLIVCFMASCGYKSESDEYYTNSDGKVSAIDTQKIISNENGKITCISDITHDNTESKIIIDYSGALIDEQQLVKIIVYDAEGIDIWETFLGLPHTVWGTYYITEWDGKKEFLYYLREESQGQFVCCYKLFHLDNNGKEIIVDEYEINSEDSSDLEKFDQRVKTYLDNSVLLISTYEGELSYYGM